MRLYSWLHYDETLKSCFCSTCIKANELRLLVNAKFVKEAFIEKGFCDWKHALERFIGHEKSECHRTAVMKLSAITSETNVISSLNESKRVDMQKARGALLRIITSIAFLAKQGLAIRGKTNNTSNFSQLLILRASDSTELSSWSARTRYKWTSHDIQNELLQLLANDVLQELLSHIQEAKFFLLS